jgi:hypothetical protein
MESYLGLLGAGEAVWRASGGVPFLRSKATGGGLLQRASVQGEGQGSTRGLRRCFSTRWQSSGGRRAAWHRWASLEMRATMGKSVVGAA